MRKRKVKLRSLQFTGGFVLYHEKDKSYHVCVLLINLINIIENTIGVSVFYAGGGIGFCEWSKGG